MLYPLKFRPILKPKIWGGKRLLDIKHGQYKRVDTSQPYGESWDISGMRGNISVVANGPLKGNNLQELVEVYMGDLVGEHVFEKYGLEFPLLIKNLDCNASISVQVHPDDDLAAERHGTSGKSEMWYVAAAEPEAIIYIGFKNPHISREEYIEAVAEGRIEELLQPVHAKSGDAYFIPAGTVHALTKGINVVEIQQPSDITYRIFDWNRVDEEGNSRELHTAWAVDAIDFESTTATCRRPYALSTNAACEIVRCDHFAIAGIEVAGSATFDYASRDSFVIYCCIEGKADIDMDGHTETICAGEVVLIPATAMEVQLRGKATIIESYIE